TPVVRTEIAGDRCRVADVHLARRDEGAGSRVGCGGGGDRGAERARRETREGERTDDLGDGHLTHPPCAHRGARAPRRRTTALHVMTYSGPRELVGPGARRSHGQRPGRHSRCPHLLVCTMRGRPLWRAARVLARLAYAGFAIRER